MALQGCESNIDDHALIEAARKDAKEFGNLYNLYVDRVFRYLFSRVGNIKVAEDITSQTFLAAFEAFGNYRHDGHFASWLFTIARNKVMDYLEIVDTPTTHQSSASIAVERMIETEEGYILLGHINPHLPEGSWLQIIGIATIRDADGKKVSYTLPTDVQPRTTGFG